MEQNLGGVRKLVPGPNPEPSTDPAMIEANFPSTGPDWDYNTAQEIKPGEFDYKYLLVFIDTFSAWTEAFPIKHETTNIVAKKLIEEILPRYGFLAMLGPDNGPAFISQTAAALTELMPVTVTTALRLVSNGHARSTTQPEGSKPVILISMSVRGTSLTFETCGRTLYYHFGKVFFYDFVEYVFCTFELDFFTFFCTY
ncbi:protein NYNRIN [Cricetulus griseus]|nr:protein NYNRIN [Cricetulus griseus]